MRFARGLGLENWDNRASSPFLFMWRRETSTLSSSSIHTSTLISFNKSSAVATTIGLL